MHVDLWVNAAESSNSGYLTHCSETFSSYTLSCWLPAAILTTFSISRELADRTGISRARAAEAGLVSCLEDQEEYNQSHAVVRGEACQIGRCQLICEQYLPCRSMTEVLINVIIGMELLPAKHKQLPPIQTR